MTGGLVRGLGCGVVRGFGRGLIGGLLAAALLSLSPWSARAENRALLVGVSAYPTLAPRHSLRGPRNDVQRLRGVLLRRGVAPAAIQVLADGVPDAAPPTRAQIEAALRAETERARPGDLFLLYMAGHGSQQPADRNTPAGRAEPDGLHEIFLPADVGRWDGQARHVHNAIADHELRAWLDAISARGAFVWAVFDACHSATLVRSAGATEDDDELRFRQLSPGALGVPPGLLADAAAAAPAEAVAAAPDATFSTLAAAAPVDSPVARGGATPRGRAVYFYASQSNERTPELRLPRGHVDRRHFGVFSFVLASLLEQGGPLTYRQLGQAVMAEYSAQGLGYATPLVAGSGLDDPVLGAPAAPVRQWARGAASPWRAPAGSLAGLAEGALVALMPEAQSDTAAALGYAVVQRADLLEAELQPVAHAGRPLPGAAEWQAARMLRLAVPAPQSPLRVALDSSACPAPCAAQAAWQRLKGSPAAAAGLEFVARAQDADLLVQARAGGAVVVLRDAGQRHERAWTTLDGPEDEWAPRLAGSLRRAADAHGVRQRVAELARRGADLGLRLVVGLRDVARGLVPLSPGTSLPRWRRGEELVVEIHNPGPPARDVTVLHADANFGIRALFPDSQGASNRLEPNAAVTLTVDRGQRGAGVERLLVLAAPARAQGERADFSHLAQPGLDAPQRRSAGPAQALAPADLTAAASARVITFELAP
jgi:hypothetical protein